MFYSILNNIKLALQTKRNFIKMRLNKNNMKLIRLLIELNFINFIKRPTNKINNKYNNYYYISINKNNKYRLKNLYRPSGIKTITYKELSKDMLLKKTCYVLSTSKGIMSQSTAIKYKLSGILVMVIHI